MRSRTRLFSVLSILGLATAAYASEAETSATAGSSRWNRNGTASATARYQGDLGWARTQSHSGQISHSRGVAVGVDREGLSLSVSRAVAPQGAPGVAATFNMTIGTQGQVSHSTGLSTANGPLYQEVSAGGRTGTRGPATAFATGRTDSRGEVKAVTRASDYQSRPRFVSGGSHPRRVHAAPLRRSFIRR